MRCTAKSVATFGLMALLAIPVSAQAEDEAEIATIATLEPSNGQRVLLPDIALQHMTDGHAVLIDGASRRVLATLPLGFSGNATVSHDKASFFVATTYYDRGNRGNRVDVLEVYDGKTLKFQREAVLPSKHAQATPYRPYLVASAHDNFVFVQNATPASSVSVVTPASGGFAGEVATAGCFGIYAAAQNDARFSSLCGDGSMLSITLDAAGHETARQRSAKLFDPAKNPLFIEAERWNEKLVMLTFQGEVHVIDNRGPAASQDAPWSFIPAGSTWRPGGYQPLAVDQAHGQLFVTMHEKSFDGSHKAASNEVWQIDLASHKLVRRLPIAGLVSIALPQTPTPALFGLNEDGDFLTYSLADKPVKTGEVKAVVSFAVSITVN
jgi:methylamine dehydrogenase heavy chain